MAVVKSSKMWMALSLVLSLSSFSHGCHSKAEGFFRRQQAATADVAAPNARLVPPPPPSILGSPAKLISTIGAIFNPEESLSSHELARSSEGSSSNYATYGSEPRDIHDDHDHHGHGHGHHHQISRSDDLDVSGTDSKEISNILAQLGDAPRDVINATASALNAAAPEENIISPIDGCCWKIRVDFTKGHGFYGAFKIHESMFGHYVMEPGLVNGKHHYTSNDPHNEGVYAVTYCGEQWWIQPVELRGQCNGYAYSGVSASTCVNEIGYTWAYYVPPINQYVLAKKGLSIWCSSR